MADPKLCSVPDCGKTSRTRGMCGKHYMRWRRHGDPQMVGTLKGEPLHYLREEILGYAGDDCIIWPYAKVKGYGVVFVGDQRRYVTRLVCEHVHGPAPSPEHEATHQCGKGHLGCITPGHLFWKTRAGNEADKLIHGTHNRGERHPLHILTEEQAREILSLKGKMLQRDIAAVFGIKKSMVADIHSRRRWAWLD